MPDPFFGGLFGLGRSAIKKANKDNQDAIVFIVFAIIFVAGLALKIDPWPLVIGLSVFALGYYLRRNQFENTKIRLSQQKLDSESARVRDIKRPHRLAGEPVQQALPLERVPRGPVDK